MADPACRWGIQEVDDDPEWARAALVDGALGVLPHTEETARRAVRHRYGFVNLVRQAPGSGSFEVVPYAPRRLPPLTGAEKGFEQHEGLSLVGIGPDGEVSWIVGVGHQDARVFARAARELVAKLVGGPLGLDDFAEMKPSDVQHVVAVCREAWGDVDEADWWLDWPITADHLDAFPVTVLATGL